MPSLLALLDGQGGPCAIGPKGQAAPPPTRAPRVIDRSDRLAAAAALRARPSKFALAHTPSNHACAYKKAQTGRGSVDLIW
jgi:hypothetical protein